MKCPKCNAKLEDGYLYCKVCGEEIKMVPDFEPELENSIDEILNNVADDMAANETDRESSDEDLREENSPKKRIFRNKIFIGTALGFAVLVLILAVVGGVQRFRYHSFDYQMKQAKTCMSEQRYDKAITYYNRALELDGQSSIAKYFLAETYMELKRVEDALVLFKEVVASDGNGEEKNNACQIIIDIYSKRNDYQAISDFLLNVGDNEVTNSFQKYMAKTPEFSYVEGTYETVVPLKLTSNTSGTIYYTIDGSTPNERSEIYSTPIFLESGDYTIQAYFVNEFGVSSEIASKTYHIDVLPPIAPEVSAYSGDYESPTLIEVEIPEACRVFYTTDGKEPGLDSNEYTTPIHMPLGKSRFRFTTYNAEGVASEIVTREYNLKLNTSVTVQDAEAAITQGMYEAGKIYDLSGLSYEIYGKYLYRYQYVTNVEALGDFYIIAEIYEDTEGIQARTGALYGVGVYDGVRYRISLDDMNEYVFEKF